MILNYKDIVNVYFRHTKNEYEIELHEVRERFGSDMGHYAKPLCKGIITKIICEKTNYSTPELIVRVGKEMVFDYSYITKVIFHSGFSHFPKINIFQRYLKYDYAIRIRNNKKILCGSLEELCHIYLGRLNEDIQVEIDYQKLKQRTKSLTGIIHNNKQIRHFVYIKKDHFERWFKKNWRHILRSKKLVHKLRTEENDRYNRQYKEDYFNDFKEQLDDDLGFLGHDFSITN